MQQELLHWPKSKHLDYEHMVSIQEWQSSLQFAVRLQRWLAGQCSDFLEFLLKTDLT